MPGWRPTCFRGSVYGDPQTAHQRPPSATPSQSVATQEIDEERRSVAVVELTKKEGCGLGLTVSGGIDKGTRPQVSALRPGSIAHRSDALNVGDFILSVNGIRTSGLKHDEIINLLKNAGERVTLEVEYELPGSAGATVFSVQSRCSDVRLEKDSSGFGFTLRGGMVIDKMKAHPLVITSIRPGGSAHREGSMQEGDRILAVNGYKVGHLSLQETMAMLNLIEGQAIFTAEYDVAVMDAVQNASGPLLVEIDKTPGSALGISLTQSAHQGKRCVCVDSIRPMSVADRSGALHIGDHILSIDGASVEHMSVAEAAQLLKASQGDSIKLEILPVTHLQHKASREALSRTAGLLNAASSPALPSLSPSSSTCNGYTTLPLYSTIGAAGGSGSIPFGSLASRSSSRTLSRRPWRSEKKLSSCMSISSTGTSVLSGNQVSRAETLEVVLQPDRQGVGILLQGGVFSTAALGEPPIIAMVEPNSAAERSNVILEGDRVLSVNGVDLAERTLEEANLILKECKSRCTLEIEFEVAESCTPSSGTYVVRIPRRNGSLGLAIKSPAMRKPGEPLIINEVKRGSIAHRCGSVQPGDRLLAVNDVRAENSSVDEALQLLQSMEDIIKLKLRRDESDDISEDCVCYTVELQRNGGPLGITISGTEDPTDPIVISALTDNGLAKRTGAIHVGDKLLAINGVSTRGRSLSEAIRMLQNAGDTVTLKISRLLDESRSGHLGSLTEQEESGTATPLPSTDSAMESWDGSGMDMGHSSSSNGQQPFIVAMPQKLNKGKAGWKPPVPPKPMLRRDVEGGGEALISRQDAQLSGEDGDWDSASSTSVGSSADPETDEWARTVAVFENGSGSEMLKQIGLSLRQRSAASLDRRSRAVSERNISISARSQSMGRVGRLYSQDNIHRGPSSQYRSKDSLPEGATFQQHVQNIFSPTPVQLHRVFVTKESAREDFGFSLSDGLYEKGVFVSAIRPGSAADRAGLKMFDRILQVGRHRTRDLDCCLTVPLIAEAKNTLQLVICRNPLLRERELQAQQELGEREHVYVNTSDMGNGRL